MDNSSHHNTRVQKKKKKDAAALTKRLTCIVRCLSKSVTVEEATFETHRASQLVSNLSGVALLLQQQ